MVPMRVASDVVFEVLDDDEELPPSERGTGGFGSTEQIYYGQV